MLRTFRNIRSGEGRDTWSAFACLFAMIGSHAVLETARDALFLASIPATRLPWMYIGIAVVSLLVTQLQARVSTALSYRSGLSLWAVVAALVTGGFWVLLPSIGSAGLYALYVWSGVLATLVLVQFWMLMGEVFSVTQARRLFGVVGAGSVLGAIAGSAGAGAMARLFEPRHLVLAAAIGFFITSLIPALFSCRGGDSATVASAGDKPSLGANLAYVIRSAYAGRVAVLLIVAAATLTMSDYVFKTTVAERVSVEKLGEFFAGVYLVLNFLSLVVQLGIVSRILRRFDLSVALSLLPFLLIFGAAGMVALPGLVAALAIKGADGSLRYSIHRTATELLFMPLSEVARRRVKGFIDVVGQRGGQALASAAILAAVAAGVDMRWIAGALLVFALLWLQCAIGLRRHYLELFRGRLRGQRYFPADGFPELDVASLETLVASLDSKSDDEVLASLAILENEGRARLVPGLILYHPSERVVLAALDLFTRKRRTGVVGIVDRLLDHDLPSIRAAAVAARSVLAPNERMLRARLSSEDSALVRTTIMVNLIASGDIVGQDARDAVDAVLRSGSVDAKMALATAISRRQVQGMGYALSALAADLDGDVRLSAVRALRTAGNADDLPVLVHLLADERLRTEARRSLEGFADEGLTALIASLDDHEAPKEVRWQIPAAMTHFDPERVAEVLIARLPDEPDGMVRFRILRALQTLVNSYPEIRIPGATLDAALQRTISRAYRYLDRSLILQRGGAQVPARRTVGHDLLAQMLEDKREHCIDRLFRLLVLRYPRKDFGAIQRGLSSANKEARVSSVELVSNLLQQPMRDAVVGLIDEMPDAERLALGLSFHDPLRLDYDGLLSHMLDSSSAPVQDLTAFHLGELHQAARHLERLEEIRRHRPSSDIDRALELSRATA